MPDPCSAIPLPLRRAVNAACERFEESWRSGTPPRIEGILDGWDEPARSSLLAELLALELELRRVRGESPCLADYSGRFVEHPTVVESAFARASDVTIAHEPTLEGNGLADPTVVSERSGREQEPPRFAVFGDYELIEEIARGGMGVVYKARQKSLNRLVALKMILSGQFASTDETSRFRLEAELAANLDHPNIVPIHEIGEHSGHHFFSMKFVEGGSLTHEVPRLLEEPLAAARLLATIARAVHFAHRRGFLHCDLKPANILLDAQGQPHITDFGLARRVESESNLTVSGALMGTPSYMAPEQASGLRKGLTPAADVYGLGAIFYELLVGRPPFRAPSVMETVVLVLEREPESPRVLRPGVPAELEQICLKCLEKSPEERYESAETLADEIDKYLRGEIVAGTSAARRLRRWTRREPELVARLGGLGLMVLLTQYNYYTTDNPIFWLHYDIQAAFVLWAAASVLFQMLLRRDRFSDLARYAWAATDILALSCVMVLVEGVGSVLLVGYPLLIAASGLWFRVRLVWFTSALAMSGYGLLLLEWSLHPGANSGAMKYPNIFLAALAVTGFVVARQVKRFWALSAYYENRPRD